MGYKNLNISPVNKTDQRVEVSRWSKSRSSNFVLCAPVTCRWPTDRNSST